MSIQIDISDSKVKEDEYEIKLKIKNLDNETYSGKIYLQAPLEVDKNVKFFIVEDLKVGDEIEFKSKYKIKDGGSHTFYSWEDGSKIQSLGSHHLRLPGPGFYSGDTHTHSTYSDGKGSLEENRQSMIRKGHSFLISTDHNTMDQYEEIKEYNKQGSEFLHIPGYEYTSNYGHAIAYNSKYIYDPSAITERNNLDQWQEFVDSNQESSFVYLAHPYEAPKYYFGDDVLKNIKNIVGIEVWNGYNHHALAYQNRKNFDLWDKYNLRGDKKYFGNAVSDAHTVNKQGNPFIKGFLNNLSEEEVFNMLKTGAYFGSNGPEIRFTMDDKSFGETVKLESKKEYIPFELEVFDPLATIKSIIINRGIINESNRFKKVYEEFPLTGEDKRYRNITGIVPVEKNEVYRVEVVSEIGVRSIIKSDKSYDMGYAYTNPIWIE